MALGLHAVEITAGELTRLELNEWGAAEMGLQKALESDGWINPDASHGAGSSGETGAWLVQALGWEETRLRTGPLKEIPPPLGSVPPQPPLRELFLTLAPLFARLTALALSSGSSSHAAVLF